MTLLKFCRGVCMDKETYNQNFIHWDRVDKDALCDAMDNILGEAARKEIQYNMLQM